MDIRLNLYHPDPLTLEEVELVLAWMKKHHDKARVEGVLKETKTYAERDKELNSRAPATLMCSFSFLGSEQKPSETFGRLCGPAGVFTLTPFTDPIHYV